jgi:hypothetical protein
MRELAAGMAQQDRKVQLAELRAWLERDCGMLK